VSVDADASSAKPTMTMHAPNGGNENDKERYIPVMHPVTLMDVYPVTTQNKEKKLATSVYLGDTQMEITWNERDAKRLRDELNQRFPQWKDNINTD
jgi:hypothetical protein